MKQVTVNNMKCAGCAKTVTQKLATVYPDVVVSLAEKTATFAKENTVDLTKLNEALADTPYSVSE